MYVYTHAHSCKSIVNGGVKLVVKMAEMLKFVTAKMRSRVQIDWCMIISDLRNSGRNVPSLGPFR